MKICQRNELTTSVIAAACWFVMSPVAAQQADGTDSSPWQQKHAKLEQQREQIHVRLNELQAILLPLAECRAPELLPKLSLEPPKAPGGGYGLLPPIRDNAPVATARMKEKIYSMAWLERRLEQEMSKTDQLRVSTALIEERTPDLTDLATNFAALAKQLGTLDKHLSYHQQWQRSILRSRSVFDDNNNLIALAREIQVLAAVEGSQAQSALLREQLRQGLDLLSPTADLTTHVTPSGEIVLPVTVCTDIQDEDFLEAFQTGVRVEFNQSPAARARRFSIELSWRLLAPETIYPDKAPAHGEPIDLRSHRAAFGNCKPVLTTGAASTHAYNGDRIVLGTAPISRRTLAHEFGHLLGFDDAYLRGYDGNPDDPYGLVIVEWVGLVDDLMGNPGSGRVTPEMIQRLIETYSEQDQ